MMYTHQQEATCGFQVCQHPLCWATNRQAARGLLHLQCKDSMVIEVEPPGAEFGTSTSEASHIDQNDEEDEDIFEGLPTVTILNMIDDYGFDRNDQYPSPSSATTINQPAGDYKAQKSVHIHEISNIVPKLALKSIVTSQSAEDVSAPANTPRQSSREFGGYHHDYRSPLGHNKNDSFKPIFSDAINSIHGGEPGAHKSSCRKVLLEIGDPKKAGLAPKGKGMLIWCPPSRSKRTKQYAQTKRKSWSPPDLKAVSLPLHSVPEFRPTPTSHKAIKATIPKKTQHAFATTRKLRAVRDAAAASRSRGPTGATPQEITQLRKVPVDVLLRVLHQAEDSEIITKSQISYLLAQVVGKRDKLPAIKGTTKHTIDKAIENETAAAPKTPFEAKNIKILNAEEARIHSPRMVSVEPVYKMDNTVSSLQKSASSASAVQPATHVSEFPTFEKPNVFSIDIPPPDYSLVEVARTEEMPNNEDSQYDEKLRGLAEQNLRSIGALPRERIRSPKKNPVKYVATFFEETVPPSPPIKPFHYSKSQRDISLGPIVSPPPPSPPTERDSMYDPQLGGSTVMVMPSMTCTSTLTSFGDKRSSSPGESKTPTTEKEFDGRHVKTTQTSIGGSQRRLNQVSSPFGSSTEMDGWPQINEDDFLRTAGSSELGDSQMPSFREENMAGVSRNDSAASPREETPKFQNLQLGEIHSPAPPPPSPEPLGLAERLSGLETSPASPRAGGAATALGLVTLAKDSLQKSPETVVRFTPSPVVSSVRSDVETPLGRVTRAQTIGSTPAIPETPYERESECSESFEEKTQDNKSGSPNQANTEIGIDFETNVSPEIAKEELEKEVRKLDIG